MSAYIPTNVISITDGQIYLEGDLFFAGIRPAVNVGLSVSRVGGAAQIKAMKAVAGSLRLDLAQYRELASFAQFGSDLDESTRNRLERGRRIVEVLKQTQYLPMPIEQQVVIIWSATRGHLDGIAIEEIKNFEEKFLDFLKSRKETLLKRIAVEKTLDGNSERELEKFLAEFHKNFKVKPTNKES